MWRAVPVAPRRRSEAARGVRNGRTMRLPIRCLRSLLPDRQWHEIRPILPAPPGARVARIALSVAPFACSLRRRDVVRDGGCSRAVCSQRPAAELPQLRSARSETVPDPPAPAQRAGCPRAQRPCRPAQLPKRTGPGRPVVPASPPQSAGSSDDCVLLHDSGLAAHCHVAGGLSSLPLAAPTHPSRPGSGGWRPDWQDRFGAFPVVPGQQSDAASHARGR